LLFKSGKAKNEPRIGPFANKDLPFKMGEQKRADEWPWAQRAAFQIWRRKRGPTNWPLGQQELAFPKCGEAKKSGRN